MKTKKKTPAILKYKTKNKKSSFGKSIGFIKSISIGSTSALSVTNRKYVDLEVTIFATDKDIKRFFKMFNDKKIDLPNIVEHFGLDNKW